MVALLKVGWAMVHILLVPVLVIVSNGCDRVKEMVRAAYAT